MNEQTEIKNYENVSSAQTDVVKENKRIKAIDRFRGFCVFAMLFFQFLKNFPSLGIFARLANHSLQEGIVILPGMTLADIIAPCFIFAIGLTYALSFVKYKKINGRKKAYIRYAARGLSIIGVGTFLAVCNKVLDSFGGAKLDAVAIVGIVLSSIFLGCLVFKLICLIPALKKVSKVASIMLYSSLSLLGLFNLVIAFMDCVTLLGNINASYYGYWVTLQNIGMACLVALPFIETKNWIKLLGAAVLFVAFTAFHQTGNHKEMLDVVVHGGFLGGFGWGVMLILDCFLADVFFKNKSLFVTYCALFMSAGVIATQWLGVINLGSCSPTFIITSVGLCGLVFFLFYLTDNIFKHDPLVWWGKNPLVMFLVEFFVLGLYGELMPAAALGNAAWWLAAIQGVIALGVLTAIAFGLNKLKNSISL